MPSALNRTRIRPTTFRRSFASLLLLSAPASAEDPAPIDEAALIAAALDGPVLRAERDATRARTQANATVAPWLPNPSLEARHEQANGPAGASVDFIGGSFTLDLGLAGLPLQRAAALQREAGEGWLRAEAVQAVCALRAESLDLWAATARIAAGEAAQARFDALARDLAGLATAGEGAGYDHDRAALSAEAHRAQIEGWAGDAIQASSLLSALADRPVTTVRLLPLPEASPLDDTLAAALAQDPLSTALRHEREAAEQAGLAARRAALPDLVIAGGARWDAYPDGTERTPGFEIGAALELPFFDRGQLATQSARAEAAALDARLARREAELRAEVTAAWQRVDALGPIPPPPRPDALWAGARARYAGDEATIDELLSVAGAVEAAALAAVEAEARRRHARLALACAGGVFPEAELKTILEETRP